jgi:hypothetical protein
MGKTGRGGKKTDDGKDKEKERFEKFFKNNNETIAEDENRISLRNNKMKDLDKKENERIKRKN